MMERRIGAVALLGVTALVAACGGQPAQAALTRPSAEFPIGAKPSAAISEIWTSRSAS